MKATMRKSRNTWSMRLSAEEWLGGGRKIEGYTDREG
jgi:hypothetical protein